MKKITLKSHPLVHTPGLLRYAEVGYRSSKGRGRTPFVNIFTEGYNMDRKVVVGLLSGKIPYLVVGDTVVLEVKEGQV